MSEQKSSASFGYQLFHLGLDGSVGRPHGVQARSDTEALHIAWTKIDRFPVELWQGARLIARLDPPAV